MQSLELYFIRHGQGEHTLKLPESLQIADAALTILGKRQAMSLQSTFPLTDRDTIIVSPVRRALKTADIWSQNISCMRIVHPYVGPRMFPLLEASQAYACDSLLIRTIIEDQFPSFQMVDDIPQLMWEKGINSISEEDFLILSRQFIEWCRTLQKTKLFIISHDGTIASYRTVIDKEILTRKDFLGETECYKVIV